MTTLLLVCSLLFLVFVLVMLGQKWKISQPIVLVVGGLIIGLIPGLPIITISPELIFTIFLPPLLYEAAWYTSWNDFWRNRRPIMVLAFGLVIFTSVIIALTSNWLIPGFTLALGFLLGGIISPPDAVAATSVLKDLKISKRLNAILEGESLLNDASSLIVVRFSLAAVVTSQFSLQSAAANFFMSSILGASIGIGIAFIFYFLHRLLPTTSEIDTALTVMAPYIMFLTAEHFHFSGVLSVVCGGLFLSYRSHETLSHESRLQATSVWSALIFILNGLVFILIGLQLPAIIDDLNYPIHLAIIYSVLITIVGILVRLLWMQAGYVLSNLFGKTDDEHNPPRDWRTSLVIGWAGMRGVVSLAAALNIPLYLADGTQFPHRSLILFITFVVILITLLGQGLTLPWLIRKMELPVEHGEIHEDEQNAAIEMRLANLAIISLKTNYPDSIETNEYLVRLMKMMNSRMNFNLNRLQTAEIDNDEQKDRDEYVEAYLKIISDQREELINMRNELIYDDDKIRDHIALLDIEETRIEHLFS